MTSEAVDIGQLQSGTAENARNSWGDMRFSEGRYGAIEDHAEALRIHIPTHDVERVGPHMLALHFNDSSSRFAGSQITCRGPVSKKGSGDNVRFGQFVEPER